MSLHLTLDFRSLMILQVQDEALGLETLLAADSEVQSSEYPTKNSTLEVHE